MTQIKVDNVVDAAGTAAADFTSGLTVAGAALSTLNTAEYYETGTEPASPKNGAIWKDTANDKVMVYIAGEFKEVELGAAAGASNWTVDLSNVSYDSVSFSVASQETGLYGGPEFSADGTKMYINGYINDSTFQYTLSTAFDLSTASYDSVSFGGQGEGALTGVRFSTDGTKMYFLGYISDRTYEINLSTAWDLSTASYNSVNYAHGGGGSAQGLFFGAEGTKLYIVDVSADDVREHTLSTAWDLSTASYLQNFSVSSQTLVPRGICFNPEGTQMLIQSQTGVISYTLSTAWDVTSASYDSINTAVLTQQNGSGGITFNADGSKMYLSADNTDAIHQYSTGL
jgi:hypothetical protein